MGVRWWTALAAAGATLSALAACSPGGGGDRPAACVTPHAAIATRAGDPSALRVVETGFTQLGPNATVLSIGAVLENTGEQVAYRARIAFKVTDAGGTLAVPASSGELLTQEVPVVLPKQRTPVGAWTYVQGRVTAVAVEVASVTWVPRDASFAEMTASFRSLARTGTDPETASVSYQLASGSCRALSMRGTAMLFRDTTGKIIGGSFELGPQTCPPGISAQRSTAQRSAPAGIDESKTEVWPYCDFAPAAAPRPSGGPVN